MLISLNELKKLVKIDLPDADLFKLIGSRLVEIESVRDLAPLYKKIYVVKVLEATPIEGTHLHLCKIDAGKFLNAEVDPDDDGFIQVVCGAPNVHAGMFTAWIAPGAIVPSTFETEKFEISARKLRGFMSFGMLAAADELALGSDHEGIVELDPATVKPGDLLANVLDLNDKIIEVENKSLTHRPDCFGLIGFAREVAGILGQPFPDKREELKSAYETLFKSLYDSPALPLSVKISDYSICPRYEAAVYDFSSLPTRTPYLTPDDIFLIKAGMRPISPLVDATNLVMLRTGQPLHAFDYDKFVAVGGSRTPEISVRLARDGEKLLLLDEKEVSLNKTDILICSNDIPVALAGAMGGKSTEIDASTRRIILETASFSLYHLRKTQMSHGIFSEAITRFTKGRPASDLTPAVVMSHDLFSRLGGKLISTALDSDPSLYENSNFKLPVIEISVEEINSLLGSTYSEELIIKTLENTNFSVTSLGGGNLSVSAPSWRTDIHIKEDLIEEVGRLLGYDNLPLSYPSRPFVCSFIDPLLSLKSSVRSVLSDRLGCHEVLTYSFVSKRLQEKVGEPVDDSYKITNSISPELECFRQSLLPSLLEKYAMNKKAGFRYFSLYELNQVSKKSWGLTSENVPEMKTELALVTSGDFYRVKSIFAELENRLGLEFTLKPLDASPVFEPLHSVSIYLGEEKLGELGELKPSISRAFKLSDTKDFSEVPSALRLYLDPCISVKSSSKSHNIKLPKFPYVSRDLTLRVSEDTSFASIENSIRKSLDASPILYTLSPTSIFKKPSETTKNLSFHLELTHPEKTLRSEEISAIIEEIVNNLSTLGAEVV